MGLTLLAIDSAGAACSAALWRDGAVLAARRLVTERGHAQHLAPLVQATLEEVGCGVGLLDGVVATVGPGSFTGLRVGLALAQGIALSAGVPAWGVSSFRVHAAAAGAGPAVPLVVAIDSRREEIFLQCFRAGPDGDPFMATPTDAARHLRAVAGAAPLAVAGDAASALAAALAAAGIEAVVLQDGPADAAALAVVAAATLAAGEPLLPARPSYLRPPDVTMPGPA